MTPYALQLDQLVSDVRMLKWTVYGNEVAGELGLVRSMKSIQTKLDTLIDSSEARNNQWKGIKNALVVMGIVSGIPALQTIGKIVGLWP